MKKEVLFGIFLLFLLINFSSAARLPTVGGDSDAWGAVLNEFLNVSLNDTGQIRDDVIYRSITNISYYLATNPFSFYNLTTIPAYATWVNVVNGTLFTTALYNTNYSNFYPTILSKGIGNVVGVGAFGYIPMWNGTSSIKDEYGDLCK